MNGDGSLTYTLRNYQLIFIDDLYWKSVFNNLKLFLTIPIMTILSLFFSLLIYERLKGWKVFRTIIIFPYLISVTVAAILFAEIFQYYGGVNEFLQFIGLGFLKRNWIGSKKLALYSIAYTIMWKQLGFGIIIFLARLSSIDEQLIEASKIDGASWWDTLIYIIIPQLASIILFYMVISVVMLFNGVFNYVWVMTKGGPIQSTYVSELYIYENAFTNYQLGKSCATSVVLLLGAIIVIFLQFKIRKKLRRMAYA